LAHSYSHYALAPRHEDLTAVAHTHVCQNRTVGTHAAAGRRDATCTSRRQRHRLGQVCLLVRWPDGLHVARSYSPRPETKTRGVSGGGRKRSSAANPLSLCASKHQAHARTRWRFSWHTDMPRGRDLRGWVCRRVTACRRRRVATGLRRMFASHEWGRAAMA
jgi:hypothetical protein